MGQAVAVVAGVMFTLPQPGQTELFGTTILVRLWSCAICPWMQPTAAVFVPL